MGFCGGGVPPVGPPTVPAPPMPPPAVTALLLTSPHRFPLCRCDDRINLLPFPLMNLLDLLPLLLHRERGIRAHRLNFLVRLPSNRSTLLDRRLANACDLPARLHSRPWSWPGRARGPSADRNLGGGVFDKRRRKNDPGKQR